MIAPERVDTIPRGGKCSGHDPRTWFPYGDRDEMAKSASAYREAREKTQLAKLICGECHIQRDCLNYSLYHESFGIWGGATERERESIRRKYGIQLVRREPIAVHLGYLSSQGE